MELLPLPLPLSIQIKSFQMFLRISIMDEFGLDAKFGANGKP